jgi:hypothetical protein
MSAIITDRDLAAAAMVSPTEAAWLTELSTKTINATIDRGEL